LYQYVAKEPMVSFNDVHAMLKTTKQEGKLMSTVMGHVTYWVNDNPTKVSDRENNKPQLRKDLVAALEPGYGEKAEEVSRVVQRQVCDYVRKHAKDFTAAAMEPYLHTYPNSDEDGTAYSARFKHKVWRDLRSLLIARSSKLKLASKYRASPSPSTPGEPGEDDEEDHH
jgi:hypothetical protein